MPFRENENLRFVNQGFSLVELVIVIAIVSIVSVLLSSILRLPIQGYSDAKRRAELSDELVGMHRQMEREIKASLPNSVRVSTDMSGRVYLEFLPVRSVGRYRAEQNSSATGDVLVFTSSDTSFDVLGPAVQVGSSDEISINNLGVSGFDAWSGDTTSTFSGVAGTLSSISFASKKFPAPSPTGKFFVISSPVSWVCDPATGTMTRYSGYAKQVSQPVSVSSAPLSTATAALSTRDVSDCSFAYSSSASSRHGIVAALVSLSRGGESVSMFGEMHVPVSP